MSLQLRGIRISILAICSACILGCSTDSATGVTPSVGADVLIRGRGVRALWATQSRRVGLNGFHIGDMALTSDGYLHATYAYGTGGVNGVTGENDNFRVKISLASGDTLATAGIPTTLRTFDFGQTTIGCGVFGLVPYTDIIAYTTARGIEGSPVMEIIPFRFGGDGFTKAYGSGDAACHSTYVNPFDQLPYVIGNFSINGVSQPAATKRLGETTLTSSVEITPAGVPLTFVIGLNDSLSVYNYETATVLTSARVPMIAQYIPSNVLPSYRPVVYMFTKRNRAGTRIAGLIGNQSAGRLSTFVYDIVSNTISIKVENQTLPGGITTFDDEGNVYYTSSLSLNQINRITPAGGDQVYRSGFINGATSGQVGFLKHIDNTLFAAVVIPGSNFYSDSRGKGKLLMTVIEWV